MHPNIADFTSRGNHFINRQELPARRGVGLRRKAGRAPRDTARVETPNTPRLPTRHGSDGGSRRAEHPERWFGLRPQTPPMFYRDIFRTEASKRPGLQAARAPRDMARVGTPKHTRSPREWVRMEAQGIPGGPSSPKHGSGGDPKQTRTP